MLGRQAALRLGGKATSALCQAPTAAAAALSASAAADGGSAGADLPFASIRRNERTQKPRTTGLTEIRRAWGAELAAAAATAAVVTAASRVRSPRLPSLPGAPTTPLSRPRTCESCWKQCAHDGAAATCVSPQLHPSLNSCPRHALHLTPQYGHAVDGLKFAGGAFSIAARPALRALLDAAHDHGLYVSTGGWIEHVLTQARWALAWLASRRAPLLPAWLLALSPSTSRTRLVLRCRAVTRCRRTCASAASWRVSERLSVAALLPCPPAGRRLPPCFWPACWPTHAPRPAALPQPHPCRTHASDLLTPAGL